MSDLLNSSASVIFSHFFKKTPNLPAYQKEEKWIPGLDQLSLLSRYSGSAAQGIGFLILEMPDFHRIALSGGDERAFHLFDGLLQETRRMFGRHFPNCRLLYIEGYGMGEKIIFFEYPKDATIEIARSYFSLRLEFDEMAASETLHRLGEAAVVRLGYSVIEPAKAQDIPRCLIKGLCEARHFARTRPGEGILSRHKEFLGLLEEQAMLTVYQPILDFTGGGTLGWEAFARSRLNDPIYSPAALFHFAEHIGAVHALDRKCREMALSNLGGIAPDQLLFINTHYMFFYNEAHTPAQLVRLVERHGLAPSNVVFEVSEKQNLTEPVLLRQAIEPYLERGFKLSIDDVDGGKSSLSFLFQLRPHFIKIDASLIRGVDTDSFKRLMVEILVYLAEKIDTRVIAMGMESENEFSSLVSMGVQAGQGFLFAGPEAAKKSVTAQLPVGATWPKAMDASRKSAKPVRDMVEVPLTVKPDTPVTDVKNMLDTEAPGSSVVVVEGCRPVGQVMIYELDRRLGTRYGHSLYLRRDITHLMNHTPLIVNGGKTVEEAAKMAMNRQGPKIYDDIIVTEEGRVLGTVSVQRLLDYMAEFQVELAKGCNPLTGLPGNLSIEHDIERRIRMRLPSSLIYLDLDNFKVYNDVYGFGKGDQVILMTADLLKQAVREKSGGHDFIGHVGGDDFIMISTHERAEPLGYRIIECFEKKIVEFYTEAHRQAGYIEAVGRDGIRKQFGFVSLSIGILDFDFETEFTLADLSNRAAEIKKYAKAKHGNSCVRERRSPLGLQKKVV